MDTETGNKYVIYALYTVIGSYKYFIQIGVVNPNKNDLEVVNEMLNSVKLGGIKEPMSPLEIALIVCVVVLLVAVAFAYFMLYRLDRFAKCGITNVSVFGFNLPAPVSAEDDSDDDDSDDDVDDFEDDTAEDSYETAVLDSDEKIVDDESDSRELSLRFYDATLCVNSERVVLCKGKPFTLTSGFESQKKGDVSWSSSDESVVKVNRGILTAVSEGSAEVTASANGFEP